ncbi:MAG: aldehyde dehydrogenase family protein [Halobacteriaceae archaeon]
MPDAYQNYVDGEWVDSETGDTFAVYNPADPDEIVSTVQDSSRADAEAAIEAADAATAEWADTPGPERGAILRETAANLEARKEELTETLSHEEGKTLAEAGGEVQRAIDIFYYYAEKAMDFNGHIKNPSGGRDGVHTVKEPLGVAALITPWNYPIAIPAWKIAPALATGNTIVHKPASAAPNVARQIVEALDDAGLPDGVMNFVTGSGSEIGDPFMTHDAVDAVSFTGSSEVGHMVYDAATDGMKRVQCEMGGKNPTLVTDSADVDEAVDIVAAGGFGVTGQACTACSRAIVHEDVYDEFVEELVEAAEAIDVGPGRENPDMGPHVTQSELKGTLDYVDVGVSEGATLETGGGRPDDPDLGDGFYVEPTVFSDVDSDMRIAQEEIFGPVVAVIPVSDYEEGLAVANDVDYGLSASIVTDDLHEAHDFVDRVESGVAKINEKTTGLELHVPFGGYKDSSSNTYREQGDEGLAFFTSTKTVYTNY